VRRIATGNARMNFLISVSTGKLTSRENSAQYAHMETQKHNSKAVRGSILLSKIRLRSKVLERSREAQEADDEDGPIPEVRDALRAASDRHPVDD
jgi:hypothetical protein